MILISLKRDEQAQQRIFRGEYALFNSFKFIPSVYYYVDNDKEQSTEPIAQNNDSCNKLASELVSTATLDNKSFISPYYYASKTENVVTDFKKPCRGYKLEFNVDVPNSRFIPRYIYFMTKAVH